jgi:hypothetical protein
VGWEVLTTLTVSREWQVSPPVVGEIFRIRHLSRLQGEGLVCQALQNGSDLSTYDVRSTYANIEPEIFSFVSFAGMTERRIAIKSLFQDAVPWLVVIERYNLADDPIDQPVLSSALTAAIANLVTDSALTAALQSYVTGSDFLAALSTRVTGAELAAAITNFVTSSTLTEALSSKQNVITLTQTTTSGSIVEMVLPQRVLISANSTAGFEIWVTGHRQGATPEFIYWTASGAIYRRDTAASTVMVSVTSKKQAVLGNGNNWSPTLSADTLNGGLKIQVKGDPGKTVKWVAAVHLTEAY